MQSPIRISSVTPGENMTIGTGFRAKHLGEQLFHGLIDPVIMFDHFHMTEPTFDIHPHAGISAVTYLFEDSTGPHVNYDSLGNNGPIHPGALHWFAAGRGAVHNELPEGEGDHVHALQIFINLPAAKKFMDPYVVHVDADQIPEFLDDNVRVRVVTGSTNGIKAAHSDQLPESFTLLDGFIKPGAIFSHSLQADWNALIYVISGKVRLRADNEIRVIPSASAIGVALSLDGREKDLSLHLSADEDAHFVVLSGKALREPIVKHGPFVMNTPEQMHQVISDYQQGKMGTVSYA